MGVRKGGAERLTSRESVTDSELEVVRLTYPCVWCITNQCSECKAELYWEKKLYMCGCTKCCDGHVPSVELDIPPSDEVSFEEPEESIGEEDGGSQGQAWEDEDM